MGLFGFLAKKSEVITFSEVDGWLNRQVEGKRLDQKINSAKQETSTLILATRKALDLLEQAPLTNDNIPVKEKQIMEGHRKVYVQRTRKFLDEIKLPDDFAQIGHYSATFSESLGRLGEETHKNYAILTHFFQNELAVIVHGLKTIEAALAKLQADIDREGVETIKEAKIKLKLYHDDYNKKEAMESELQKQQGELDLLIKKKEKIEANLEHLKQSNDYQQLKGLFEDKKKNDEIITAIEQELIASFSELNRPLKKYTHNTANEKITDNYIADPLSALEEDDSLAIQEVLKKMLGELSTLDLTDKQYDKVSELINKLSRGFLSEKKTKIAELKTLNRELSTQVNRSVVALNIAENESWLKSLNSKIGEWQKTIDSLAHEIEQINLGYLKQKAKEKIKEINPTLKIQDEA